MVRDQIKAAPKDGMAMGIAMKALAGQPVESDDVKAAVASLRGMSDRRPADRGPLALALTLLEILLNWC